MKLKNYEWHGFGFPVIFEELPAVKIRGELVPDVDWKQIGEVVVAFICSQQKVPLSGDQVKFIRNSLNMSLRNFAKFVGVTHQSLMRWEKRGDQPAQIEAHIEIVLRLKVLRELKVEVEVISEAFDQVEDVDKFRSNTYRHFKPMKVSESAVHGCF
ncbi:MAG: helix-turn-helix domain-containing protein [Pseudobdellovibrionaceae bacterium]